VICSICITLSSAGTNKDVTAKEFTVSWETIDKLILFPPLTSYPGISYFLLEASRKAV
jgi:hypothetical protein